MHAQKEGIHVYNFKLSQLPIVGEALEPGLEFTTAIFLKQYDHWTLSAYLKVIHR